MYQALGVFFFCITYSVFKAVSKTIPTLEKKKLSLQVTEAIN